MKISTNKNTRHFTMMISLRGLFCGIVYLLLQILIDLDEHINSFFDFIKRSNSGSQVDDWAKFRFFQKFDLSHFECQFHL